MESAASAASAYHSAASSFNRGASGSMEGIAANDDGHLPSPSESGAGAQAAAAAAPPRRSSPSPLAADGSSPQQQQQAAAPAYVHLPSSLTGTSPFFDPAAGVAEWGRQGSQPHAVASRRQSGAWEDVGQQVILNIEVRPWA